MKGQLYKKENGWYVRYLRQSNDTPSAQIIEFLRLHPSDEKNINNNPDHDRHQEDIEFNIVDLSSDIMDFGGIVPSNYRAKLISKINLSSNIEEGAILEVNTLMNMIPKSEWNDTLQFELGLREWLKENNLKFIKTK